MNRTVAFHTLGCKLNFAESSAIGLQLKEAGFKKTELEEGADVVVINTCSVTENADKECRSIVRKALQRNPDSFVAVIGCYAQLKPEEISRMDGVDLVLGATEKFNLPSYLSDCTKRKKAAIHSCTINEADIFQAAYSLGDRTRAFLKVQDGCNFPCSYCTIPLARGASRSATIPEIIAQVHALAEKEIAEIVLTGVNIGDFGIFDSHARKHESSFLELLKGLDRIDSISRFRISSIEPNLLSNEVIDFVSSSSRIAPHFHIPLQSGSDTILGAMRRRYKTALYADRISRIKQRMPHACIGADVIVGFPGETENDFLETYRFINESDISYLHVFTYSERENTEAATLPNSVQYSERKKRNKMLRILSEKKRRQFYLTNIGRTVDVLFEEECKNDFMHGYSENYIRVRKPYDASQINKLQRLTLEPTNCIELTEESVEIKA